MTQCKAETVQAESSTVTAYVCTQLKTFFPGDEEEVEKISSCVPEALAEVKEVVSRLVEWKERGFNKLISWQYATFLYKLAHIGIKNGIAVSATDRLFLLNKALNGLDLHPQIDFPKIFFLSHTNSAVFARAEYSDYSVFHQGVTVGRNGNRRPTMERYLVMYPSSMIIGNCYVRENTVLAPGVRLIDRDTPGNCYVFDDGNGGFRFKEIDYVHASRFFEI